MDVLIIEKKYSTLEEEIILRKQYFNYIDNKTCSCCSMKCPINKELYTCEMIDPFDKSKNYIKCCLSKQCSKKLNDWKIIYSNKNNEYESYMAGICC